MNVNVCKWVLTPPAATVLRFLGGLGVRRTVFVKLINVFSFLFFFLFFFIFKK